MQAEKYNVLWLRRDLRLYDNAAMYHALNGDLPVIVLFIFDQSILSKLEDQDDARVSFIHDSVRGLHSELANKGGGLLVEYGVPKDIFSKLNMSHQLNEVFANEDYEPYAKNRDEEIAEYLKNYDVKFTLHKDQVIFSKNEVLKSNGDPYTVYTPYMKAWKELYNSKGFNEFPIPEWRNLSTIGTNELPSLESLGFVRSRIEANQPLIKEDVIKNYHENRDIPGGENTSRLGVHLRFGTVSIRHLMTYAIEHNKTWWNELIWREFYMMILWHFPYVVERSFKKKYDQIKWINNEAHFNAWCQGRTGYPIVDAGMRELNATGFMHNRVRMIAASFLTKHLLINWQWGEAYFARRLLDFELASNNGGWQWSAGTGCDAAPYFRVFNPYLQTEKFDSDRIYINKWVPEVESEEYPEPIVEHKFARERALQYYKLALN